MTEETKLFWEFIFSGATAAGTIGAVIISLAVILWPKKRFIIHSITARADKILRSAVDVPDKEYYSTSLIIDLENRTEFQMQVFNAHIHVNSNHQEVLRFNNSIIPAMGRYSVAASVPQAAVKKNSFKNSQKIKVTINTSFGNKTALVSNPALLHSIMESKDEYIRINIPTA